MATQPNKPADAFESDGEPQSIEDQQAVQNQGEVEPSDYPEAARDIANPAKK